MTEYNRKFARRQGSKGLLLLIIVLFALLITVVMLAVRFVGRTPAPELPTEPAGPADTVMQTEPTAPADTVTQPVVERNKDIQINLGCGLVATQVGSYTGAYMEDGSNDFVNGVLMLRVQNTGEQDIQYTEITLALTEGEAQFVLSTLPAGQSVILLEQNRLLWNPNEEYAYAVMSNPVLFAESISLQQDALQVQLLSGGMNVTNISGQDINDDIVIYYKNAQKGLYYGGITYRVRLEGGLKAGELRQLMNAHLTPSGTEIMFVTIG